MSISPKLQNAFLAVAVALGAGGVGSVVSNGCASYREFNEVESQVRYLAETGKMTAEDGTPKPHVVKFDNGAEYAVSTSSALQLQNGQWRDAAGATHQQAQQTGPQGAAVQSAASYQQNYKLEGKISRIKGSDHPLRWFFNYGGENGFTQEWAVKPPQAPMSRVITAQPQGGATQQVPATPAPIMTPQPGAPTPSGT
ncbi:MAG: hypothetical protein OXT65_06950 [Alphaproteobacteria bacterium]|nr:hypothetical protein [Alphaproteobacteria bacterium]